MQFEHTVGFVGGGRIVSILLGGWQRAGFLPAGVVVGDCNAAVLEALSARFPGVRTTADTGEAAQQDVVFLAVHPPVLKDVAAGLRDRLGPRTIVVSLAPKIQMAKLSEWLGGCVRVARCIPNAASLVGHGCNPVTFGEGLSPADRATVCATLAPLGDAVETAEDNLETYAVVTAMGLTFLWPQLYALQRLAGAGGLSADASVAGLQALVAGAVAVMRDANLTESEVMNLVPVKPLAEEVETFLRVAEPKLVALRNQLRP